MPAVHNQRVRIPGTLSHLINFSLIVKIFDFRPVKKAICQDNSRNCYFLEEGRLIHLDI